MAGKGSKPGEYRGGRKKGTPNKKTAEVKAALTDAFAALGGVPFLIEWGKENKTEFMKLWAKMLPTEVKAEVVAGVKLRMVEEIVDAVGSEEDSTPPGTG